jgi:hypothetical protein
MIDRVLHESKSDAHLAVLLDEAREYAQIYRLAKQRHKGCEGTGELMTLKEEFRDAIDKMILYCRKMDLLSGDCCYDPDLIADALASVGRVDGRI